MESPLREQTFLFWPRTYHLTSAKIIFSGCWCSQPGCWSINTFNFHNPLINLSLNILSNMFKDKFIKRWVHNIFYTRQLRPKCKILEIRIMCTKMLESKKNMLAIENFIKGVLVFVTYCHYFGLVNKYGNLKSYILFLVEDPRWRGIFNNTFS